MTFSTLVTLLAGFTVATTPSRTCQPDRRRETIGGGLMATGLVLLGIGLHGIVEF